MFLHDSSRFLSVLIVRFKLFFKTGHLPLLAELSFLYYFFFDCQYSIWFQFQSCCWSALHSRLLYCLVKAFNCINDVVVDFQWNRVVQFQQLLEIEPISFDITESARFVFSHYFTIYNKNYRKVI